MKYTFMVNAIEEQYDPAIIGNSQAEPEP